MCNGIRIRLKSHIRDEVIEVGRTPMCFGAGGMATQVASDARTGRAPIFLGSVLVIAGLLASGRLTALLTLLPSGTYGRHAVCCRLLTDHWCCWQCSKQERSRGTAHHRRRVGLDWWRWGGRGSSAGSGLKSKVMQI